MARAPIPKAFTDLLAPLVRRHPRDFTADDAKDYYAVLRGVEPQWLAAAVGEILSSSESPFMPMPATLLVTAAQLRRRAIEKAIEKAPDCEHCRNHGLVTARDRGAAQWYSLACCCVRGREYASFHPFDPSQHETWWQEKRRLVDFSQVQEEAGGGPQMDVTSLVKAIGNVPRCAGDTVSVGG